MNKTLREQLNLSALPVHIGIIMDGIGRWAKKRGLPGTKRHNEGVKTAKETVHTASEPEIPSISLYTFFTENWKCATDEVSFLMQLIKLHLRKEFDFYKQHNIRVTCSSDPVNIPQAIVSMIIRTGGEQRISNFFIRQGACAVILSGSKGMEDLVV